MASIAGVCRCATRITARCTKARRTAARDFQSSAQQWAAHNFVMPAMSPTMTEGNIATWKVKEGDSFSAGDVLLEIETDKAQMDVEAQEDGIMAKIMEQDGAKSVKVGARIAVLADEGDDVSSLDIPPQDNKPAEKKSSSESSSSSSSTSSSKQDTPSKSSASSSSEKSQPSTQSEPQQPPADRHPPASSSTKTNGKSYPLYPSVQHLLHHNGISKEDASNIPATGPNGRLLKGDVLSHLGTIEKSYSSEQSERLVKLSHLDLSNIKKAAPPPPKKDTRTARPPPAEEELPTEVAVPVSLAAVFATQRRIQESLGLTLPLSTFIARASELANEDLPRASGTPASSDELFDAVLGLRSAKRTTRGRYRPNVTALPPPGVAATVAARNASRRTKEPDVLDMLTGATPKRALTPSAPRRISGAAGVGGAENVFSVSARKGEERRARTYLERVKTVLESEPGRCVL